MMKLLWIVLFAAALWAQDATASGTTASIQGRVRNLLTGAPVRKAEISLTASPSGGAVVQAITNSDGYYVIGNIPAGRYQLSVHRPGYLPVLYGAHGPNYPGRLLELAPAEHRKDVNFTLEPPGVITGHVFDEDGEPLPGILVQAMREDYRSGKRRRVEAARAGSNDEGEYRIYGLPPGRYYVNTAYSLERPIGPAEHPEAYAPIYYPGTNEPGGAAPLNLAAGSEARDIDLRPGRMTTVTIKGSIVNGVPNLGARVWLLHRDSSGLQTTNRMMARMIPATGEFELQGVVPGSYTLLARQGAKSETLQGRLDLDVGPANISDVRIELSPAMNLSGTLMVEGSAEADLTKFRVSLLEDEETGLGPPPSAKVNQDGTFTLSGVTAGAWEVRLGPLPPACYVKSMRLGDSEALHQEIEIGADTPGALRITISGNGSEVNGTVRMNQQKPEPIEAATVLLLPVGERNGEPILIKNAVSESDGKFRIAGVPPGKYRVLVFAEIETGAWQNPDFLRPFEGKGETVEVSEGSILKKDVFLTPHN